MKKHITALFLIVSCIIFSVFIFFENRYKNVQTIYSPTKIGIDLNQNKIIDSDEIVCIDGVEAFSTEPPDDFIEKYTKSFNITREDIISLGYLAQEFTRKQIENESVKIKFTDKTNSHCKSAKIFIRDFDYSELLLGSGFGIKNGKIENSDKFKENLQNARKLNLVILNHKSGKYHTLDCPYGKVAHDTALIPQKQLPHDAKPCKFCHNTTTKFQKGKNIHKFSKNYYPEIPFVIQPELSIQTDTISIYLTDFTKQLIPNKKCQTHACKEVINLINNANKSIDIAIYGYDDIPDITNALTKAKNRGVIIRFVFDENFNNPTYYKGNVVIQSLAKEFSSDRNPYSKSQSNMLMHNKFIIFDNSTVYTGSMNFSSTGTSGYDVNDIIVIKSKEIAKLYTQEFEQMLNGKFHNNKNKISANRIFHTGDSTIEIYFSPKDKSANKIIQIINNAKHYIYIPAFLITHDKISEALINAHNKNIDVRVIIDANSITTKNSKHSVLRNSGIPLKTENIAGKLHSKMIIVDDEYLISGSMNFSNSGENRNDENVLIIKNSKIAKLHKDFFLYLWTIIPNKYLKQNALPESMDSIGSCDDGIDNNFNGKTDKEETLCK